jgi:hypothetical protein
MLAPAVFECRWDLEFIPERLLRIFSVFPFHNQPPQGPLFYQLEKFQRTPSPRSLRIQPTTIFADDFAQYFLALKQR